MKTLHRLTYLAVIYGLLLAAARADENSAPYFQIVGNRDAAASESLPLKSSSAKVSIDGTIAKVHLTQRYANSGSVPIEAIYVFPASTRAAVHGMTLTTGGRVIAAIRGAAELLDEDMPVEVRKRFLENIRAETARSERLINRLLELAAIEGRASLEKPEELDFHAIAARAIDQARPLAEVAGVVLEDTAAAGPVLLRGDAFILRAAVTNLLENAIDFSPQGSKVEISVHAAGGNVVLTIRDHCPGIPDYAREKIFERFYSLRHHTSKRKGTGLGLTLVKETAELHGGTITLEPAEGGGTVARLTLPLA